MLKVNVHFFQWKDVFLHLAQILGGVDILMFFLVRFFSKNKFFARPMVVLY